MSDFFVTKNYADPEGGGDVWNVSRYLQRDPASIQKQILVTVMRESIRENGKV